MRGLDIGWALSPEAKSTDSHRGVCANHDEFCLATDSTEQVTGFVGVYHCDSLHAQL